MLLIFTVLSVPGRLYYILVVNSIHPTNFVPVLDSSGSVSFSLSTHTMIVQYIDVHTLVQSRL